MNNSNEQMKDYLIDVAKKYASEELSENKIEIEPVFADISFELQDGLLVIFPDFLSNEEDISIDLKKIDSGKYYFQVGHISIFPLKEETIKFLLKKPLLIFAVLPYRYGEDENIVRHNAGIEVARITFEDEDLTLLKSILEEIEKVKIKEETKIKMIERLKAKGMSDEEIEEMLREL